LIRSAYLQFPNGNRVPFVSPRIMQQEIKGSPAWIDSERFTVEAKTEGPATVEMLRGPMLQMILEDRFNLKIRRETKEVPIYELRTGKGGPKLKPAKEGSCVVFDRDHPPPEPVPGKPIPPVCGGFYGVSMFGTTMANLAQQLTAILDRDVIDKTGIDGAFDIQFEFPPPDLAAGALPDSPRPAGPDPSRFASDLQAAIPRLGLRLEPARGSAEFLVIDHVEKPSEN
jgi:uncharacterized protein (TIGR03435 family)